MRESRSERGKGERISIFPLRPVGRSGCKAGFRVLVLWFFLKREGFKRWDSMRQIFKT